MLRSHLVTLSVKTLGTPDSERLHKTIESHTHEIDKWQYICHGLCAMKNSQDLGVDVFKFLTLKRFITDNPVFNVILN